MSVYLSAVSHYNLDAIKSEIAKGMKEAGVSFDGARKAVLKVNLVQAFAPETGVVVHPVVVESIIDLLHDSGVRDVTIAEAPALGVDPQKTFQVTGYADLAKRKNARLLNLFDALRTNVSIGYGYRNLPNYYEDDELQNYYCGYMSVPTPMLESDIYINVAKLKTHNRTTVSLTMKNQWGLLSFKDRQMYHRLGLHEPIAQLARAVRPHMTVVDGILAMEGNGPILGHPKPMGVLLVGKNMVETDIVGAKLMGADPEEVLHIKRAISLGLGRWETDVRGMSIESLAAVFDPAPQDVKKNHNLYVWRNHRACHLDDEAFHKAFRLARRTPKYWMFIPKLAYYMFFKRIDVVRGRGNRMPEFRKNQKILISGDCARDLLENYEEIPKNIIHIPGCPPDPEEIIKAILAM
ncbi:MAG: DUF362 domain-containing protein [Armatimonadota bacterium]